MNKMEMRTLRTFHEHLERFPKCFQTKILERVQELHPEQIITLYGKPLTLQSLLLELSYTLQYSSNKSYTYRTNNPYWWSAYISDLYSKKIIIKHDLCEDFLYYINLYYYYCHKTSPSLLRHFDIAKNKYPELKGFTIKDFNIEMK